MKKRNVMTMALSLAMVGVIAVGGTLAYLTATDDAVVNTFTFAQNIVVTLDEDQPATTGNETITSNSKGGFDYTNVVPGQTLNKAPEITVTTSVNAYVFARITESANVEIDAITEGWTKVPTSENTWYKAVNGQASVQNLGTLFTKVTVRNESLTASSTVELEPIKIQVAAIQQEGFDGNVTAAMNAATFADYQG